MINLRMEKGLLGESHCMCVCACVCILLCDTNGQLNPIWRTAVFVCTRVRLPGKRRDRSGYRDGQRIHRRRGLVVDCDFHLQSADGRRVQIGLRTTPYNLITVYYIVHTFSLYATTNRYRQRICQIFPLGTGRIFTSQINR